MARWSALNRAGPSASTISTSVVHLSAMRSSTSRTGQRPVPGPPSTPVPDLSPRGASHAGSLPGRRPGPKTFASRSGAPSSMGYLLVTRAQGVPPFMARPRSLS
jgi:hypothetical protein